MPWLERLDLRIRVDICKFLIGHGAKTECKDLYGEIAILKAARSNLARSPNWTQGLLQCGADLSAVHFKWRGPLHLI